MLMRYTTRLKHIYLPIRTYYYLSISIYSRIHFDALVITSNKAEISGSIITRELYGDVLRFPEDYISRVALIHKRHLSTLSGLLLLSKYTRHFPIHILYEKQIKFYIIFPVYPNARICLSDGRW